VESVKESVTWGESEVVREIYADERQVVRICAWAACFSDPDNHAEGSASRIAAAEEGVTVSARMDDDDEERVAGASYVAQDFCYASHVSRPLLAFSDDPSPFSPVPISPFVLLARSLRRCLFRFVSGFTDRALSFA